LVSAGIIMKLIEHQPPKLAGFKQTTSPNCNPSVVPVQRLPCILHDVLTNVVHRNRLDINHSKVCKMGTRNKKWTCLDLRLVMHNRASATTKDAF
jgi:hypothetical protein